MFDLCPSLHIVTHNHIQAAICGAIFLHEFALDPHPFISFDGTPSERFVSSTERPCGGGSCGSLPACEAESPAAPPPLRIAKGSPTVAVASSTVMNAQVLDACGSSAMSQGDEIGR